MLREVPADRGGKPRGRREHGGRHRNRPRRCLYLPCRPCSSKHAEQEQPPTSHRHHPRGEHGDPTDATAVIQSVTLRRIAAAEIRADAPPPREIFPANLEPSERPPPHPALPRGPPHQPPNAERT